jgi:hemoglobin
VQKKRDIENREDITLLIRAFYTRATQDELIGTFFTEVAAIKLEEHLPIMYDFWENILFRTGAYRGGMMQKHIQLNRKKTLEKEHFARWLELFEQEVDKHFEGPQAEEAKKHAKSVAPSMHLTLNRAQLPISWL